MSSASARRRANFSFSFVRRCSGEEFALSGSVAATNAGETGGEKFDGAVVGGGGGASLSLPLSDAASTPASALSSLMTFAAAGVAPASSARRSIMEVLLVLLDIAGAACAMSGDDGIAGKGDDGDGDTGSPVVYVG